MKERPRSITIIGWFLIVLPSLAFLSEALIWIYFKHRNSIEGLLIPNGTQIALLCVSVLINVICGIFILKGRTWARILYVVQAVINLANDFVFHPLASDVLALLVFLVIVFFLFRPKVNEYFSSENAD